MSAKSARSNRNSVFSNSGNAALTALRSKIKSLDRTKADDASTAFDPYAYGVEVVPEQLIMFGKAVMVRRVYLVENKYKIGWVVDCDLFNCMICGKEFGWYRGRPKHHCRACGALVCGDCSPYALSIPVLNESGGSRACVNCVGLRTPVANQLLLPSEPDTPAINLFNSPAPLKTPSAHSSTHTSAHTSSKAMDNSSVTSGISRKKSIKMENYQTEMDKLDQQEFPKYEEAYRIMREIIPLDIYKSKATRLTRRGLPEACLKRIWNTKVLWLIITHSEDIKKVIFLVHFLPNGFKKNMFSSRYIWLISEVNTFTMDWTLLK
jgi:hypothetical protein